jgi:hypothetical protein
VSIKAAEALELKGQFADVYRGTNVTALDEIVEVLAPDSR